MRGFEDCKNPRNSVPPRNDWQRSGRNYSINPASGVWSGLTGHSDTLQTLLFLQYKSFFKVVQPRPYTRCKDLMAQLMTLLAPRLKAIREGKIREEKERQLPSDPANPSIRPTQTNVHLCRPFPSAPVELHQERQLSVTATEERRRVPFPVARHGDAFTSTETMLHIPSSSSSVPATPALSVFKSSRPCALSI